MCVRQSVTGHCDTKGEEQSFHRPCFSPPPLLRKPKETS
uniref:Uncharacterized protein n=1 Tax=Anguilla anguilla TaxID=7936 RepID=A0A0E9T7C6_ANGAN